MHIAVLGSSGLLGADLVTYLSLSTDKNTIVTAISRDNYDAVRKAENIFDVFINANGNSKRFWAINNPLQDFTASTVSVYNSLYDFKFKKYIYISSSDVYENHTSPATTSEDQIITPDNLSSYGFHKFLSEHIVRNYFHTLKNTEKHTENNIWHDQEAFKDFIILRSCLLIGTNLRKGPFFDALNNKPLFITPDTELQVITTKAVSEIITALIALDSAQPTTQTVNTTNNRIFNIGGTGTFKFNRLSKCVKKEIIFSPEALKQVYEMDVSKLGKVYTVKDSSQYVDDFLHDILH